MEQSAAEINTLVSAQLHRGQADLFNGTAHLIHGFIDENSDPLDFLGQFGHDRACGFKSDITRTLRIKDEAQRIRTGFSSGERIVEVCVATDLDPSHKSNCRLSAFSSRNYQPFTTTFASSINFSSASPGHLAFINDSPISSAW